MTFLYFAYGSNMLPARLVHRCPSARAVGLARVYGFALEFSKSSNDLSGKATLVENVGNTVPGVVFEIDASERDALDRAEGLGQGYRRDNDFPVEIIATGERVSATTYIATKTDLRLKPFDWYLAVVIAGAVHNGMDEQHVAMLRSTDHIVDGELDRPTRLRALEAMLAHDVEDFRVMLHSAWEPPVRS